MSFTGNLRPYQQAASDLVCERERALLALDLGTGKTVVAIHAIERLRDEGKVKCAVLIMSSSLTRQWANRIQEFTDEHSVIVVDGTLGPAKRTAVYQEIAKNPPAYLIMGIRQVVKDLDFVLSLKPDLVLVDEATSIKNFSSQQSKAVKKLKTQYRIGLTAEPIENGKAEELYSIMQWIDPDLFGGWREFEDTYIERNGFGMVTGYKNVKQLHELLMTACVNKRRSDKDVAEFMPTVQEYNTYVEMDDGTRELYRDIAGELHRELLSLPPGRTVGDISAFYSGVQEKVSDQGELGRITSRLLALHLLLDSPELLRASGRAYSDPADPRGSQYAAGLLEAGRLPPEGFVGSKLEACVEMIEEVLEEDLAHKVIVFARFKGVLPLLAERLPYESVQFHGGLNGAQRGEAIDKFSKTARVFLSSDAGGAGVDLYMASHLINYDLPLSAGMYKQRNGRHVRASSLFRDVTIDNLIVSGSVEEYQLNRLQYKAKVADAIVSGRMSVPNGRVTNDAKSLTKFLEDYLKE